MSSHADAHYITLVGYRRWRGCEMPANHVALPYLREILIFLVLAGGLIYVGNRQYR